MHGQHLLMEKLLKRKFFSWNNFCSYKEESFTLAEKTRWQGCPQGNGWCWFLWCTLSHKEITSEQHDSHHQGQSPVPLTLRLHFYPSALVSTDKGRARLQKFNSDYWKGVTAGWNMQELKGGLQQTCANTLAHEALRCMQGQSLHAQHWWSCSSMIPPWWAWRWICQRAHLFSLKHLWNPKKVPSLTNFCLFADKLHQINFYSREKRVANKSPHVSTVSLTDRLFPQASLSVQHVTKISATSTLQRIFHCLLWVPQKSLSSHQDMPVCLVTALLMGGSWYFQINDCTLPAGSPPARPLPSIQLVQHRVRTRELQGGSVQQCSQATFYRSWENHPYN